MNLVRPRCKLLDYPLVLSQQHYTPVKKRTRYKRNHRWILPRSFFLSTTFSGVLSEKDILTLPQLARTFSKPVTSCFARSTPYRQQPAEDHIITQARVIYNILLLTWSPTILRLRLIHKLFIYWEKHILWSLLLIWVVCACPYISSTYSYVVNCI